MKRALLRRGGMLLVAVPFLTILVVFASPLDGDDNGPARAGLPNPAARHCVELGGISRSADAGVWGGAQLGLCRLRDDGVIASWTLFRAAQGERGKAVKTFLQSRWTPMSGPIETWAEQACTEAGGQVGEYVEHLRPSSVVRLCEFPDRSLIEVWTMFSGPNHYPELARTLGWTRSLLPMPRLGRPASDGGQP